MADPVDEAAQSLFRAHADGNVYSNVAREFGVATLGGAYDIQDRFVALMAPGSGPARGYKIGLTSATMQEMCGIDQPIAGAVLESRIRPSGAEVPLSSHARAGIECEIAVRLGRDLGGPGTKVTLEDVAASVDGVCAAFEIIDDRCADYTDLDVNSLVADNSWNAGVVLGSFTDVPDDLADAEGTVLVNGETVDSGYGRAALGHTFEPVRWLADHLGRRGRSLGRGEFVMTGSLVKTRFPQPGERYRFEVSGIGAVEATFIS